MKGEMQSSKYLFNPNSENAAVIAGGTPFSTEDCADPCCDSSSFLTVPGGCASIEEGKQIRRAATSIEFRVTVLHKSSDPPIRGCGSRWC